MRRSFLVAGSVAIFCIGLYLMRHQWSPASLAKEVATNESIGTTFPVRPVIAMGKVAVPDMAPAKTALAPISKPKLSFDRELDLYALASAALQSNDPMEQYNGYLAVQACVNVLQTRVQYESLATSNAKDARSNAARDVINRCRGFFDNDLVGNQAMLRQLSNKLKNDSRAYFAGVTAGMPNDEQVKQIISRGDWSTFVAAQSVVHSKALAANGLTLGSPDEMYYAIAWLQAACDVGQDCSGKSIMYSAACLNSAKCPGTYEQIFSEGVSPAGSEKIRKYRAEIAAAFQQKNFEYFGLGP